MLFVSLPPCGLDPEFPPNACRGERRGVWGRAAPIKPVHLGPGILVRGPVAKRAVWTTLIIFDTPALQDNVRFAQIAEELAVEAFIAQLVMKALNVSVLPRAPGRDVKRLNLWAFSQSCMQVAINSGPLSLRRCSGAP